MSLLYLKVILLDNQHKKSIITINNLTTLLYNRISVFTILTIATPIVILPAYAF